MWAAGEGAVSSLHCQADVLILSRANACGVLEVGDRASLRRLHIMRGTA